MNNTMAAKSFKISVPLMLLLIASTGCGREEGPTPGKTGVQPQTVSPRTASWPALQDRPVWRADILWWITKDDNALRESLADHFKNDPGALEKHILRQADLLVEYRSGKANQHVKNFEETLNEAKKTRNDDMLLGAIANLAENHPTIAYTKADLWFINAVIALKKQDYDLATWSAENSLIIDPTAGDAFALKLFATGKLTPNYNPDVKSLINEHTKKLKSPQEHAEFLSRLNRAMQGMEARNR